MTEGVDLIQIALNAVGPVGTAGVAAYFLREWLSGIKAKAKEHEERLKACEALVPAAAALAKDLARLSGTDDNQQKQLTETVKDIAKLQASVEAVWRTLERGSPQALPKRPSDGGDGCR